MPDAVIEVCKSSSCWQIVVVTADWLPVDQSISCDQSIRLRLRNCRNPIEMAMGRSYRVYQRVSEGQSLSLILENTRISDEFLLFESGVVTSIGSDESEIDKRSYNKVTDAYGCLGVLQMCGASQDRPSLYLTLVTACVSVGKIGECDVYRITAVAFVPLWMPFTSTTVMDERILDLQRFLSAGTFYFSWAAKVENYVDLSLSAQKRFDGVSSDSRFFWNRTLHLHLLRFGIDTSRWLLRILCGGIEIKTVYVGHKTAKAVLVSRLSCERAGTRFNVRGINDFGHVANFCETEQVIYIEDEVTSFVQIRGSVPLFWTQPGIQVGSHKVKMSRGFEASIPAYDRHFRLLKHTYGQQVIVNLLGNKEGEKVLTQLFKAHHENSGHNYDVPYVWFDYHSIIRAVNKPQNILQLWDKLKSSVAKFGIFYASGPQVVRRQTGSMRTNCLDCLDRTNCVQSYLGLRVLLEQLETLGLADEKQRNLVSRFEEVFRVMWTINGDHVSNIYAGTGALDGKSKLRDGARSVGRTIQNNILDTSKQEAIDIFLFGSGLDLDTYDQAYRLLPVNLLNEATIARVLEMKPNEMLLASPTILKSVVEEYPKYTMSQTFRVFCGTWNVNGGQRFNSVVFRNQSSISDWLLDLPNKSAYQLGNVMADFTVPIDIFAVGVQEIVDLNAGNIMKASTANQKIWLEEIRKTISREHKYVCITSEQLVGVCMFIFIRPPLVPFIRDVAIDTVKTGLGGATGNKGGIAMRFVLHSTSICFICSHFAAGQSAVAERNSDCMEIAKKVQFPMGLGIYNHDFAFWFGDFNYRIDLTNEETKQLIRERNWDALIAADQLSVQRNAGKTFIGFNEAPLSFPPTYKYDTFSDDYDTSEKCRNPAWTDRILWYQKSKEIQSQIGTNDNPCHLLFYGRAELKTSDHRPVGAFFDIDVLQVNEAKREETFREVVGDMGPPDCTVLITVEQLTQDDVGFPREILPQIFQKISELEIKVLLRRFIDKTLCLIFADGAMALLALSLSGVKVGPYKLNAQLRCPEWKSDCETELKVAKVNAEILFANASYNLLSESDLKTNQQFDDMEQDDDEDSSTGGSLTVGGTVASGSGRNTPVGMRRDGSANDLVKVAPPRPAAPPKRPPAPKIASFGHPNSLYPDIPSQFVIENLETANQSVSATGVISKPTNITHVGAKTPEEAELLISSLQRASVVPSDPFASEDPDWSSFTSTRTVGSSQFYSTANPAEPKDLPPTAAPTIPDRKPVPMPRSNPSSKTNSPTDDSVFSATAMPLGAPPPVPEIISRPVGGPVVPPRPLNYDANLPAAPIAPPPIPARRQPAQPKLQ